MALFQTDHVWLGQSGSDGLLHFDFPRDPLNRVTPTAVEHLHEAITQVERLDFRRLILRSTKSGHFLHGPSPAEWRDLADSGRLREFVAALIDLADRLQSLPIPVIALVTGRCLGAGLALALACDYRIGLASPKVQFGFPEIGIGLIPTGGATQRLPRVIGLERAAHMVLFGHRIGVTRAHRWGLIDAVAETDDLPFSGGDDRIRKVPRSSLPLRTWRQRMIESHPIGRKLIFHVIRRFLRRNTPQDVEAPYEFLNALEVGLKRGFAVGIDYERRALDRLADSDAFAHLTHILIERDRIEQQAKSAADREIATVGLLGDPRTAALMAASAVLHGKTAILEQPDEASLSMMLLHLMQSLEDEARKTLVDQAELRQAMARIHGSHTWRKIDEVDLAVLCGSADRPIEASAVGEVLEKLPDRALLAVDVGNAACDEIVAVPGRNRVVAVRFPALADVSPVIEVIRESNPSPDAVGTVIRFFADLERLPIGVNNVGGSLLQRVMGIYWREAITLVAEGIRADEIDRAMRQFGMREGPLEFLDRIGLDRAAKLLAMDDSTEDVAVPDLQLLCDKGWMGRKSGKGFYRWGRLRRKPNHLAQNTLILAYREAGGATLRIAAPSARNKIIRDRLVGISINEAVRCLGDGVIDDWRTLDVAVVLGGYWAPHRGGPIHYARTVGYARTLSLLRELADTFGERFAPAEHWCALVEEHGAAANASERRD